MIIRKLTPQDVKEYRRVRLAALRENPPAFSTLVEEEEKLLDEAIALRLQQTQDGYILGAFQDDNLEGIIRFSYFEGANEKHRGYIAGLYINPDFRRCGLAKALIKQVLVLAGQDSGLRRIHLSVVTSQDAAIELYKSFGFRIYGTECEAFSVGGKFYDEHLMELVFPTKYIL
jgi:ribosomal protein S18 acetylase RimI-like enzyme